MLNKKFSSGISVLLWLVASFELVVLCIRFFLGTTSDVPLVGTLLSQGAGSDKIAPILIITVFSWVLLDILFHAIRVLKERNYVQLVKDTVPGSFPKINSNSMVGRRCELVMEKYTSSPDELREALPAFAALDSNIADGLYTLTKVFVWILPVLGFIGTAWGMSHAIAGFSDAMKETSDIAVLTERLGQTVIPGLAHAFGVTILALVASIISHFCVTTVQSWEQDVLNDLDGASVRWIGTLPSRSMEKRDQDIIILQQIERLNQNIELQAETANLLKEAAEKLGNAGTEVSMAANALKDSVNIPYNITVTRGKI